MEKEGLEQVLGNLEHRHQMEVEVLVTDRHRQINKWIRENHSNITHYYDVWHVAKGTKHARLKLVIQRNFFKVFGKNLKH